MCANHTPGCISTALLRRRRIALRGPPTVRPGLLSPFRKQYILSLFNSAAPRVAANHPPGCISTALLVRPTQVHLQNFNRGPRFPLKLATAPPQLASPGNAGLVQGCTDTAELPITALTLTQTKPAFRHRATFSLHIAVHKATTLQMVLALLPSRGRLYCYTRVAKTMVGQQKSTGARAHTSAPSTVTTTSPCRPCSLRVHGTRVHAVDNHGIIPIHPRTWPRACGQRPPTEE